MVDSAKGVSYAEYVSQVMPEKQVLLDSAIALTLLWHSFGRARSKSEFPRILGDMCLYLQRFANYYNWADPFESEPGFKYQYRDVSEAVHVLLATVTLDQLIGQPQSDLKRKSRYLTGVFLSYLSSIGLDVKELIAGSMTRNCKWYESSLVAKDFGNG